MNLDVIPTGAALGVEVRGLDLSEPMDDRTFATIERAYDEHGVIFFRDQRMTPSSRSPSPAASARSSSNILGNVGVCRAVRKSSWCPTSPTTESRLASDARAKRAQYMCYAARPPRGTISMQSRRRNFTAYRSATPNVRTAAAARDALPKSLRHRIEDRRAVFDFTARKRSFPPTREEIERNPPARHPIVRTI